MLHRALIVAAPCFVLTVIQPATAQPVATVRQDQGDRKAEFDKKREEAGNNVDKLWQLHTWCEAHGMDKEGRSVLRAILKVNDGDRKAHELLGELEFDGKWFPNQKKVDEYKAKKLEEDAKKSGKVVYKGELVDPGDVEMLERGMKKLDTGRWVSAEEYERITKGWKQQDLEWVSPEEAANIEKGLWKCGDKWLTEAEANTYHAELGKWWKVPTDHFLIYSTNSRNITNTVIGECENAYREFNRILGKLPTAAVPVLSLNSLDQFNQFANGIDNQGVELRGFSSLRGVTMAEIWQEPLRAGMTSAPFCYWDKDFGVFYARHAAGQAVMEALDPSPKTLAALAGGGSSKSLQDLATQWWQEKRFPEWFRYGACTYVERYIALPNPPPGQGRDYLRSWSIGNIMNQGGLDPIPAILEFKLSLDAIPQSQKLLNESGLLMAFILDGKCPPVAKEHGAVKDAFKNGKDLKGPIKALEEALKKSEAELRKFVGA